MRSNSSFSNHRLTGGQSLPRPLSDQIDQIDRRLAELPAALFFNIPTGFPALDEAFGGGIAAQDLMLIAGKQNVGKTILALQIARNIASWAQECGHPLMPWVLSYEHDDWDLLSRLLCMESLIQMREAGNSLETPLSYWEVNRSVREIKGELDEKGSFPKQFLDLLFARLPAIALQALMAISRYMPNLMLSLGDRTHTTVQAIEEVIVYYKKHMGMYIIPVIDYLQTIPPPISLVQQAITNPDIVHERNIGLVKDLGMRHHVPVIAVAAVEDAALRARRRVHIEDIFGPIQAQYTPDRVIILNPDDDDGLVGEARTSIRLSLEKNRRGPSEIEWQHERVGRQYYLETDGVLVKAGSYQEDERQQEGGGRVEKWSDQIGTVI